MKVLTIVGARPQFIKAAPVCRVLRQRHTEILVHTGQHYDYDMSAVFFEELGIPEPAYNLDVGSASHGRQTAAMLVGIEELIMQVLPDWVLVYGDTNSTLAGALAAAKLHVPLAHVEAGLRSFNWRMPEEVNRVLTDRCSHLLFCPTQTAVAHLAEENICDGVYMVGDVMYDALQYFLPRVDTQTLMETYRVSPGEYVLATAHRPANTDTLERLQALLDCLALSAWPVLLPAHPRTAAALERFDLALPDRVRLIEPVSYLNMLGLEKNARFIMTDSGGVQKEAYIVGVPCITLREETEWVETVKMGWNCIVGLDPVKVSTALAQPYPEASAPPIFGDGTAAEQIVNIMERHTDVV